MIDNAVLLQVDATIIVGVLIFLTIRPLSTNESGQKLERYATLISMSFTIFLLGLSAYLLLFGITDSFYYNPKLFTVIGIFVLLVPVIVRTIARFVTIIKPKSRRGHVDNNN